MMFRSLMPLWLSVTLVLVSLPLHAAQTLSIPPTLTVAEDGVAVQLCATLSGVTGTTTNATTFTLATVSGTATADTDFTAVTMSLTYPMGTPDGANDQCIDVTSVLDDLFEGDETFTVELTDLTGATSTADMTTVTITDDDDVTVSIPATASFSEDARTVQVCATLTGMSAVPVSVTVSATDGTAVSPADYVLDTTALTFPAESTDMQCADITITDDDIFERDETFTMIITVDTAGVMATLTMTTVTITDNDDVTVSIPATASFLENAGTVQVCATLTGMTADFIDVTVSATEDTAVSPSDYTLDTTALTFPADMQCADITITDDGVFEGDETFTVTITVNTAGVMATMTMTTVTITDNDVVMVSVPSTASYSEGDGTVQVCATLTGMTAIPISVTVSAMDDTSVSPSDYTLDTTALTFPAESTDMQCADITITDDALFEGDETFTVTIDVTTLDVTEGNTMTTVTITENDVASVSVPAMVSVTEGDGTVQVCATLTGMTAVPIGAAVSAMSGTAMSPSDYTLDTTALTFPAESTDMQCANITITDDDAFEGDETFTVTIDVTTFDVREDNTMTTVTISADEDVSVSVLDMDSVPEDGGPERVCATLSVGTDVTINIPINITLATSDGTATAVAGSDYVAVSDILMFPMNSVDGATQCVNITIIDDALFELNENFTVTLTVNTAGVMEDMTMTEVTITDNDVLTLEIPATASVSQDAGTTQVCATLTGMTAIPISVTVSAMDDTAESPSDYTLDTTALTFPAESTDMQCANITITDDDVFEGDETFTVTIDVTTLDVMEGNTMTTVTITENNDVSVSVPTMVSATEGDGTVQVCAELLIDSAVPISITLGTSDSTALSSSDYNTLSEMLTFPTDSSAGTMQCINITITDDEVLEADETFTVTLTLNTADVTSGDSETAVTITDDDTTLSVSPTLTVAEDIGTAQVCVTVSTAIDIDISVTGADGTATRSDFTVMSGITITADSTGEHCADISVLEDTLFEGDETFTVTLAVANPSSGVTLDNDVVEITITDNEDVSMSVPTMRIIAEGDGTVEVCATLSAGGGVITAIPVDISLDTSDDTAVDGSDYTMISAPLRFPMNSDGGDMQCENITITDDTLFEGNETFTVTLTASTPRVDIMNDETNITIIDNEDVSVSLPTTVSVAEGAGMVEVCATLSGPDIMRTDIPISILLATADGTAAEDSDYTSVSLPLMFPTNSMDDAVQCVNVTINQDNLFEGENETFFLMLTVLTDGVTQGDDATNITIVEDDDVTVSVPAMVSVSEGDGTVEVCATLSAGAGVTTDIPISITLSTLNGTAKYGEDFEQLDSPFDFPINSAGGDEHCVNVTIMEDTLFEGDETFTVNLMGNTPGVMEGILNTVTTITDNEDVMVSVPAMVSVSEGDGTVQVCATLSAGAGVTTDIPLSITLATLDGEAEAGEDYDMMSTSISFPTNSSDGAMECMNFTIMDNDAFELNETFTMTLTVNTAGVMVGNSITEVTIADDEAITVSVPLTASYQESGGGTGTVMVCATLSGVIEGIQTPISITLATSDSTSVSAVAGMDYITTSDSSLEFPVGAVNGDMSQCLTVMVTNDEIIEGDETFTVTLTVNTVGVPVGNTETTVTITTSTDDFVFLRRPNDQEIVFDEGAGVAELCLQLQSLSANVPIETNLFINVSTQDISAMAGSDYSSLDDAQVTFQVGSLEDEIACINISIIDDNDFELEEMFSVEMTPEDRFEIIIGGGNTISFIITDNEVATISVPSEVSVSEGNGTVEVCVTLSVSASDPPISITLATTPGSAVADSDYESVSSSLMFPAGSINGSTQCIDITITDDEVLEADETFTVTLTTTTPRVVVGNAGTTVTILTNSDDFLSLRGIDEEITIDEGAGVVEICVLFQSASTNLPIQTNLSISVNTQENSAVAGSDYSSLDNAQIIIPAGSIVNTEVCINVSIVDDDDFEQDEMFTVEWTPDPDNLPSFLIFIGRNMTTVIITDNDVVTVSLPTMVSVSEAERRVEVCATLSGVTETPINITLVASDSSAIAGSPPYIFTFRLYAELPMQCVNISIVDDDVFEGDETFTVTLTVTTPGVMVGNTVTTVTIIDDDPTYFQLKLTGVQDCQSWISSDLAAKDSDVIGRIVQNVVSRCECDFTEDQVTDRVFQCFPSSPQTVTYHGQLHMTQDTSVMELITDIQEWVSTGVSIPVQFLSLGVEEFCAISSSSPLEQCPVNATTAVPPSGSGALVGAVVAGGIVLLLVVMVIIVVLVIIVKRRHRSSRNLASEHIPPLAHDPVIIMNTLTANTAPHEYEDVHGYSRKATMSTEFDFTSCPAYSTTSGQPQESDYEILPEGEGVQRAVEEDTQNTGMTTKFDITTCPAYTTTSAQPGKQESEYEAVTEGKRRIWHS